MNNYIYLIQDEIYFKIGYTYKSPKLRLDELQIGNPRILTLINTYNCIDGKGLEFLLHRYFHTKHILGEWYQLDENDVDNFIETCNKLNDNLSVLNDNYYFKNKIYK
jgi:hypothetical protein